MSDLYTGRREILRRIVDISAGVCMTPLSALAGAGGADSGRGVLRGKLVDGATGRATSAKIRVTESKTGRECWPEKAIRTKPDTDKPEVKQFFYARERFEAALPPGRYRVEVVRGISHEPVAGEVEIKAGGQTNFDVSLGVVRDMHARGWYSGNTHTHYHIMKPEESPDERLKLVPPAEALDLSVISFLIRKDLDYATNRYPVGRLKEFSQGGTLVDMGEECRNNLTEWGIGYGHVLFLNIPRLIEPVSTGLLARGDNVPDFPTISMICEKARKAGGTTVWCHNGQGLEMPVAAALGVIDAFNVGDSSNADYERYYRLLNCGLRMPLSTGTDWWIYDHNRVFVETGKEFNYDSWLMGLRQGRTFVTNGPLLSFTVEGKGPGSEIRGRKVVKVRAEAESRVPFDVLEIVQDGVVVRDRASPDGRSARVEMEVEVKHSGWLAARTRGARRTRAGFLPFAHTGPVYLRATAPPPVLARACKEVLEHLDNAVSVIRKNSRFASQADQAIALGRFAAGQEFYARRAAGAQPAI
jgi:hypothetical protein